MAKRTIDREPVRPRDSTADLVSKVRGGDRSAENEIVRRNLPELRRWARGRLPGSARGRHDTEDLVQETMLNALQRLPKFDASRPGGLRAYLRRSLRNRVCDEVRHALRFPAATTIDDALDRGPTPHDVAAAREAAVRYGQALGALRPTDRGMVQAYIERGWTYAQIAKAFEKPTLNAARIAVSRALKRLLAELRRTQEPPAAVAAAAHRHRRAPSPQPSPPRGRRSA